MVMKLETIGFVISIRPHTERDLIITVFTVDYGLISGLMRFGQSSRNKIHVQPGMLGNITWSARLDHHLGNINLDIDKNLSARLMSNPPALAAMNSMFALLIGTLPEREQFLELYDQTLSALLHLSDEPLKRYSLWEINLINALGYGLNLTKCSGCGKTDHLTHISPKTGRAVCADCAAPYLDKLFILPEYLKSRTTADNNDINASLNISGFFLNHLIQNHGGNMPSARDRLILIKNLQSLN